METDRVAPGPARVAGLPADPTRARFCLALLDGRAVEVTPLGSEAFAERFGLGPDALREEREGGARGA